MWRLSKATSFWILAVLLGLFLFAASAPSPLYPVYARLWHFSPITVTAIYAVYAAGALGALLTTGRLSDHLGRRPIVLLALAVQILGMLAFVLADGIAMLYVGRVLQGVGTGLATGAISAWLLDLQPPEDPRRGSTIGGIALLAGLAAGPLGSGLLVEYAPHPLRLVFWVLVAAYLASVAAVLVAPDDSPRVAGWRRSLRPRIGLPASARSQFATSVPALVAIWALAGLYLSLGPSLAILLTRTDNRLVGGLVIVSLAGAGAVASALSSRAEPRLLITAGPLAVVVGVAVTLVGLGNNSTAALFVGSVVAGVGLGPSFSGVVRSLGPLAPPERRGELFASIYVVTYLSFSLPAIIAGAAVTRYGLRQTTYVYGAVVMVLAALTTLAVTPGLAPRFAARRGR